jgi:hypothetical protein
MLINSSLEENIFQQLNSSDYFLAEQFPFITQQILYIPQQFVVIEIVQQFQLISLSISTRVPACFHH